MKFVSIYFFIALFLGFFIVYANAPSPDIVIKFPNLKNAENIMYVDIDDVCYKYTKKKIACPVNSIK
jgi:hypothetical protein